MMMMHYIGTMVMIIRGNWNDSSVSDNDHVEVLYFNKRRTIAGWWQYLHRTAIARRFLRVSQSRMRKIRKTAVRMEDNGSYLMVISFQTKRRSPQNIVWVVFTQVWALKNCFHLCGNMWPSAPTFTSFSSSSPISPGQAKSFGHQGVRRGLELRLRR